MSKYGPFGEIRLESQLFMASHGSHGSRLNPFPQLSQSDHASWRQQSTYLVASRIASSTLELQPALLSNNAAVPAKEFPKLPKLDLSCTSASFRFIYSPPLLAPLRIPLCLFSLLPCH